MAAKATPVEIGTKGTVGSLILREIEYFSRLGLGSQDTSLHSCQATNLTASTSRSAGPKHGSLATMAKKKKKGVRILPNMCSMVEVADSKQPKAISGFAYRNLKSEIRTLRT